MKVELNKEKEVNRNQSVKIKELEYSNDVKKACVC